MKEKILIIEDDPLIRNELKTLLQSNGYEAAAPEDFSDVIDRSKPNSHTCFTGHQAYRNQWLFSLHRGSHIFRWCRLFLLTSATRIWMN